MTIDSKHIVTGKGGKQFVTLGGLLEAAYAVGLKGITSHVVQSPAPENGNLAVVEVSVYIDGAQWTCVGDASPASCAPGSGLQNALPRFAESRGLARALRFALHVDLTADVEMGGEEEKPARNGPQAQQTVSLKPATMTSIVRARNDSGMSEDTLMQYLANKYQRPMQSLEDLTEAEGSSLLKALRQKLSAKNGVSNGA